mmetsp:Transcript_28345/g.77827  ORF Transcript_28345/g.77827 Transcript_28345/m.77827 type:complete len:86 (+) Transcript_28345:814-1071(+)
MKQNPPQSSRNEANRMKWSGFLRTLDETRNSDKPKNQSMEKSWDHVVLGDSLLVAKRTKNHPTRRHERISISINNIDMSERASKP